MLAIFLAFHVVFILCVSFVSFFTFKLIQFGAFERSPFMASEHSQFEAFEHSLQGFLYQRDGGWESSQ